MWPFSMFYPPEHSHNHPNPTTDRILLTLYAQFVIPPCAPTCSLYPLNTQPNLSCPLSHIISSTSLFPVHAALLQSPKLSHKSALVPHTCSPSHSEHLSNPAQLLSPIHPSLPHPISVSPWTACSPSPHALPLPFPLCAALVPTCTIHTPCFAKHGFPQSVPHTFCTAPFPLYTVLISQHSVLISSIHCPHSPRQHPHITPPSGRASPHPFPHTVPCSLIPIPCPWTHRITQSIRMEKTSKIPDLWVNITLSPWHRVPRPAFPHTPPGTAIPSLPWPVHSNVYSSFPWGNSF